MSKEPDDDFKAMVVATILNAEPEKAISLLCKQYEVSEPKLGVGVFKGRTKGVRAVYSAKRREILAARREFIYDPFTVLHEFYHHLRSFAGEHRGTEKYADRFASEFIKAYNRVLSKISKKS